VRKRKGKEERLSGGGVVTPPYAETLAKQDAFSYTRVGNSIQKHMSRIRRWHVQANTTGDRHCYHRHYHHYHDFCRRQTVLSCSRH